MRGEVLVQLSTRNLQNESRERWRGGEAERGKVKQSGAAERQCLEAELFLQELSKIGACPESEA